MRNIATNIAKRKASSWASEKGADIVAKIFLLIISPFFAFLYSLRTMRTRSSYVVFFMFAVFFGMAITVSSGKSSDSQIDGASYREQFEDYSRVNEQQFIEGWLRFLTFDKIDYYFDTVAYYLTRVTGNYHAMFMIFAMVFAFFMLRSFRFLTSEANLSFSVAGLILTYWFMNNQLFNINGVRFWTAAWVAIYSIFQIFRNGNKRYWLLALTTPYFHGSFWIFLAVLLLAQFTRRFEKLWVILFILSFFISNLSLELLKYSQPYLPDILSKMVDSYTDPDYIELRGSWSGYGWVPYTFGIIGRIYQALLIFLFIKNSKEIRSNKKTEGIYLFLLVWATVFNFFFFIPSLGGRYNSFVWPMIAYIWLVTFNGKKYQKVLYAMPIVSSWSILVMLYFRYPSVLQSEFLFSSPFQLIHKYLIVG